MSNEIAHILKHLPQILPPALLTVCEKFLVSYPTITEIRLRRGCRISFTAGERNIESGYVCDSDAFDSCVSLWLGSERYKQSDNILNGVITLPFGFRAGIAGNMLITNGSPINVYGISSLNIRLPRSFCDISLPLYNFMNKLPYHQRSTLLIAPPCNGKTTVLRDIARILSTPPVSERVCVVDTKRELAPLEDEPCPHMDVFSGYPVSRGIDHAVNFFNPRYIVCDEIGQADETDSLRSVAHSGVPVIASAHSSSLLEALSKPILRILLEEKVFHNVAVLILTEGEIKFTFSTRREIERVLCLRDSLLL